MTYHFKIGQEVQFKSWEEMKKEYGLDEDEDGDIKTPMCFCTRMKHFCGTSDIVEEIKEYEDDYGGFYQKIVLSYFKSNSFDNYMFKPKITIQNLSFQTLKNRMKN